MHSCILCTSRCTILIEHFINEAIRTRSWLWHYFVPFFVPLAGLLSCRFLMNQKSLLATKCFGVLVDLFFEFTMFEISL